MLCLFLYHSIPCLSLWERWPSTARTERGSYHSKNAVFPPCRVRVCWSAFAESRKPCGRFSPLSRLRRQLSRRESQVHVPCCITCWREKWSVSLLIRSIIYFTTAHLIMQRGLWFFDKRFYIMSLSASRPQLTVRLPLRQRSASIKSLLMSLPRRRML